MGIDDADSYRTQVFYSEKRDAQLKAQADRDFINSRRKQGKQASVSAPLCSYFAWPWHLNSTGAQFSNL
jgi:hypothetical protein